MSENKRFPCKYTFSEVISELVKAGKGRAQGHENNIHYYIVLTEFNSNIFFYAEDDFHLNVYTPNGVPSNILWAIVK